jgi:ribosomal protein S18 acetylase RimI-like enzyme
MADVTIRLATPDDVAAVRALWKAADSPATVTNDDDSVARVIDREVLLVAETDGKIVGSLIATFDGWRGNMYRIAVHPDLRRRGIAIALVREGERRLVEQGCIRIAAIVLLDEEHATGFWAAAGYEHDRRVGRFVKGVGATGA